jgi:UDP-N-acetylglucosamine 2-epimerase
MRKVKVLTIFGTRPEAIKLAPLILESKDDPFIIKVCITRQHDKMLQQVLDFFEITPDHGLEIMQPKQSLYDVTSDIVKVLGWNKKEKIVDEAFRLLTDFGEYEKMAKSVNPYGDGKSSERILSILKSVLS